MTESFYIQTRGGQPSREETYSKIQDLLRQLEDQCAVMSHLHQLQDNPHEALTAHGWLGMAELFKRSRTQVINLATGKMIRR